MRLAAHSTPRQQQRQQQLPGTGRGLDTTRSSSSMSSSGPSDLYGSNSDYASNSSSSSGSSSSMRGGGRACNSTDAASTRSDSTSSRSSSNSGSETLASRHQQDTSLTLGSFALELKHELASAGSDAAAEHAAAADTAPSSSIASTISGSSASKEQWQTVVATLPARLDASAASGAAAAVGASSSPAAAGSGVMAHSWSDWVTARGWRGEQEVHRQQLLEWFGASPQKPLKGVMGGWVGSLRLMAVQSTTYCYC